MMNNSLQHLSLVSAYLFLSLCSCVVALIIMRGLQQYNQVGDAGAFGLGEGLKVNSSLQKLYLVSSIANIICMCCESIARLFDIL